MFVIYGIIQIKSNRTNLRVIRYLRHVSIHNWVCYDVIFELNDVNNLG